MHEKQTDAPANLTRLIRAILGEGLEPGPELGQPEKFRLLAYRGDPAGFVPVRWQIRSKITAGPVNVRLVSPALFSSDPTRPEWVRGSDARPLSNGL